MKYAENAEERIKRFSGGRIAEHWIHVALFTMLVCTGLSQRFHMLDISQWMIFHLNGIDSVRMIHRLAGMFFSIQVITHIAVAALGVIYGKWQPSMVITRKDFTDIAADMSYYLNMQDSPARGGRYTYKQKFEYWAILTGVLIMMATGVIIWFPVAAAQLLPGEIIPAAKVLHANHAMVVFLIISIWHVYNAVFSPDVFPLDTAIFTGYISRERMLREHGDEVLLNSYEEVKSFSHEGTKARRNNP